MEVSTGAVRYTADYGITAAYPRMLLDSIYTLVSSTGNYRISVTMRAEYDSGTDYRIYGGLKYFEIQSDGSIDQSVTKASYRKFG